MVSHGRTASGRISAVKKNVMSDVSSLLTNKCSCLNPPGGRREVLLNQDFFVSFGKTTLKPEEVVVSVFIPFTRKVQIFFSYSLLLFLSTQMKSSSNDSHIYMNVCPAGGVCPSFPSGSEEGELLRHSDDRHESVLLGGIQSGSGYQHLLRRNGADHCERRQNLRSHRHKVFPSSFLPSLHLTNHFC